MARVVVDYFLASDGTVSGLMVIHTDDPATAAMLLDLDANPVKRVPQGYADVCHYHGAPVGLTRWHHLQDAKVVSGVPSVKPPKNPPQIGETLSMYTDRVQKEG